MKLSDFVVGGASNDRARTEAETAGSRTSPKKKHVDWWREPAEPAASGHVPAAMTRGELCGPGGQRVSQMRRDAVCCVSKRLLSLNDTTRLKTQQVRAFLGGAHVGLCF